MDRIRKKKIKTLKDDSIKILWKKVEKKLFNQI